MKACSSSSVDIERIRRGRYGWNDEWRELLWGLRMVEEVRTTRTVGVLFAPLFLWN